MDIISYNFNKLFSNLPKLHYQSRAAHMHKADPKSI